MPTILVMAGALVVQAPVPAPVGGEAIDVAFAEMAAGRSEAAIDRIEAAHPREAAHPARLINLGIAHARLGDMQRARDLFEKAALGDRVRLEMASGAWLDSRDLAKQAIAMLAREQFSQAQFAAR